MKSRVRLVLALAARLARAGGQPGFRPSPDMLAGKPARHWSANTQSLAGLVWLDGKIFRMGGVVAANTFRRCDTQVYRFAGQGIALTLTFVTPLRMGTAAASRSTYPARGAGNTTSAANMTI